MKIASPGGARRHPTRKMTRKIKSRGFTLLEVLVTLAVVAMTLAAVAQLGFGAMRSQTRVVDRLSTLALAESWLADRSVKPSVGETGDRLRWSIAAAEVPDAPASTSNWRPVRVQLEIKDARGGRWTLETVRLVRAAPR